MTDFHRLTETALTLNSMLEASGVQLDQVVVFRHRPAEPALNRVFDRLAAERPDLFDCYQSNHAARTEAALTRARYVASFIRHTPKSALFIGLYEIASSRALTIDECMSRPAHRELMTLGMSGIKAIEGRETVLEFDLQPTGWHVEWRGRLIVRWPGLERSWYRWADRNQFVVDAIAPESVFQTAMPPWDEIVLTRAELALLPQEWCGALSQWRGIYLIIDQSDGMQYVGSAYGSENILQRWTEYARTGHGGNKHLRSRDLSQFRFSILQRVSPDLDHASVIRIENTWKDRLGSRWPGGLNDN